MNRVRGYLIAFFLAAGAALLYLSWIADAIALGANS